MWHRHRWQKFDVEFNEPLPIEERTDSRGSSVYQEQSHGFTNITWKCLRCPGVKVEKYPGKVSL